jgi:RecB family exonuclease
VFIGTPEQARGRSFRIVFEPGLAERIFPERPREDPLLLDAERSRLSLELRTQEDRVHAERMLLRLAVGAAEECVVLSYPRIDAAEARPRVPSFYALDVARATCGSIPDSEALERRAASESQARLAWPAPPEPRRAIDAVEHDLATIGPLLYDISAERARGRARYLLQLNPHVARSLRARWQRWHNSWSPADGLVRRTEVLDPILQRQRPNARPYSVTALQRYAVCPYQFLLSAVHRLEPRKEAVALVQMDPLTRGRMFHDIQARTLRTLQQEGLLPVQIDSLPAATRHLDAMIDRVADAYHDDLAPPILRVWQDEVEAMRADLRIWLSRMAGRDEWVPEYFELAFGLPDTIPGERDPRSVADPVTLADGWQLRGAVDLVERSADGTSLRVTDHKTGRNETVAGMIVAGGRILQPALYALAIEAAFGEPVVEGRLSFCTRRGEFAERVVHMDELARAYAREALALIDQAVQKGALPPAPGEGTCRWCDFRSVCGPHEEQRVLRKNRSLLHELEQIHDIT